MTYAQHLAANGGLACCGDGLGVMVTPHENIKQVPAGWVFIPLEEATEEVVQGALEHAKEGRKNWLSNSVFKCEDDRPVKQQGKKKRKREHERITQKT